MAMFVDADDRKISPLPSLLTLGNMICGFVAVVFCIQAIYRMGMHAVSPDNMLLVERSHELMSYACLMIFFGMVFDMLDGRIARMTNSACRFGGELDSLCDAVTFGVAPALILVTMWATVQPPEAKWWSLVVICSVVYAACAMLRLARYNTEMDTNAKNYFGGLPSPAAAGAVVSTLLFVRQDAVVSSWRWLFRLADGLVTLPGRWGQPHIVGMYVLAIYMLLIGLLMVSEFRFVHLANLWLGGRKKFHTLVAIVFVLALLLLIPYVILFVGFNGYVVFSLIYNLRRRVGKSQAQLDQEMSSALSLESEEPDAQDEEQETNGASAVGEMDE